MIYSEIRIYSDFWYRFWCIVQVSLRNKDNKYEERDNYFRFRRSGRALDG